MLLNMFFISIIICMFVSCINLNLYDMKTSNKTSWVNGDNNVVLFQNKNWSIEKTGEKEICISDGWRTSFGYFDSKDCNVKYDWIFFPEYIKAKAIKLASRHIQPLI